MRFISSILLVVLLSVNLQAQERKIPRIPNIPGYETLLCDFHLHTVFSDGNVWPTVRVDEAWREGLDAIAITDHLEYKPHKDDVSTDFNRSWQIAKDYARDKNVIVLSGCEITKGMPPGHFNALFIKDANPIYKDDYQMAIQEAANQGAFIIWNHPGWKAQQPDTMKWWDEHTYLYNQGWLHGIEIVNSNEYYPAAIDWAIEKNLTILGNSDEHAPFLNKEFNSDDHRPLTLVFVTEKSEGGIRDALFSGRTLAYFGEKIIGKETFLQAILQQSVKLLELNKNEKRYSFTNSSDFYFTMELEDIIYEDLKSEITLRPGHEVILNLPAETEIKNIEVSISNLISGSGTYLRLPLASLKNVQ